MIRADRILKCFKPGPTSCKFFEPGMPAFPTQQT
jgi:hypothetical protein